MEKTRFSQLTASELKLLNHCLSQFDDVLNTNIDDLKKEIQQQIAINEWNKTQFKTKKRIEELEKELIDLKKLLNN
jgi:translation initiation factor 1 (eIF-1/SUI1)